MDGGPSYDSGMKDRLDKVTALLCGICQVIDDAQGPNIRDQVMVRVEEVDGLRAWWKNHQQEDAARLRRESDAKKRRRRDLQARIAQMENELEDL